MHPRCPGPGIGLSLVLALMVSFGTASSSPAAGPCPVESVLEVDGTLQCGDGAFSMRVRSAAASSRPEELVLDLLARRLGPRTGKVRSGTYLPHLDVAYRLAGPAGSLDEGKLEFRLSPEGPSYGLTIPVEALDGAERITLELTLGRRVSGSQTAGLPTRLEVAVDLERVAPEAPLAPTGLIGPAGDRFDLVSNFDPLGPDPQNHYSDVWGYSDGTTVLALLGAREGTYFVDVTVPTSPVQVGFVAGPTSTWRDIKTYGTYAFIVTEGPTGVNPGMQIVNLANPLAPVLTGTYTDTFVTCHNLYIDTQRGHAWAVGTDNGTRVLDVTQPGSPVEIGAFTTRYVHDAYVADGYAHLSEISNGLHEILDAGDVSNLQQLSIWATPGNFAHNSWANDDQTVLVTTDEKDPGGHAAVYDISSKTGPIPLLSEIDPNPDAIVHNAMFDDDDDAIVAFAWYGLGLRYVDLHRPGMPVLLGSYDTYPNSDTGYNGAWGVYAFDPRGYIYISDRNSGLYVLEHAPNGGTLSGFVRNASNGEGVPGADVLVLSDAERLSTGADGLYAVYVEQGEISLRVDAPGYQPRVVQAGTILAGERLDFDVDLEPLPGVALSGTVRRSDSMAGIEGAEIAIAGTTLSTQSGAGGAFVLSGVPVGQQVVTAEAVGFASQEARVVLAAGTAGTVDLLLEPGVFGDDAESDQGWTLGVGGDAATSGLWERVDPNGTGGGLVQPEDDHTAAPGVRAFITGQSLPGAAVDDANVEGGVTTLLSPMIDATGLQAPRVRFHRWMSNDAGVFAAGQLRAEVTGGGISWFTLETQTDNASGWVRRSFALESFTPATDEVRVRFVAEPGPWPPTLQVLECGVDDVDLVSGCLARFSPDLGDSDGDGLVDECDSCPLDPANDRDGDGRCGDLDNAPFVDNPGQGDDDADGVGDVADNCPSTSNHDQHDLDGDGSGDACDADIDGDGVPDASDPDRDDDGVSDATDICPEARDPLQQDNDFDGTGDACDKDDGVVRGLRMVADALLWEAEDGSEGYNLYRGHLGPASLQPFAACRRQEIETLYAVDPDLPVPSEGFIYLVTRTAGGVEGSPGFTSDGSEREILEPCP